MKLDDFNPFIGKFFWGIFEDRIKRSEPPCLLYSNPNSAKTNLNYPNYVLKSPLVFKFSGLMVFALRPHDLGKGFARLLTLHELHELDTAINNKKFDTTNHREEVLPNAGKDFFRLSHLTPDEQMHYLNPPLCALLGIRTKRKSDLSILPKDVVRYMCKLAIADARTNDPLLKFE